MDDMWQTSPAHQEDRVPSPARPPAERLRDAYFADVRRLTFGAIRGERWRLAFGPLTLMAFGLPAYDGSGWTWAITGGLLVRQPGGSLRFAWRDGELEGSVEGYRPVLPGPLYRVTQVPVHRVLTRRFLLRLRGRAPLPGAPAGPAQRLLGASLDLALCAGVASLLRPRHRLAAFVGLAGGYHLACWTAGGRTAGALLTGQRVVSVDGSPVAPWQALLRLAAVPLAIRALRPIHDEVAETAVVEA
jgi:hypothetical protein